MILRHKLLAAALLSVVSLSAWAQQDVTVRIPELENNTEYLDLLRSDVRMRQQSDSLMSVIRDIRSDLARNAEERDSLAQLRTDSLSVVLADTESAIYNIRGQMMKLVDRINSIEQEHLLASMGNIRGVAEQASGSIFTNAYFRKSIDPDDYKALAAANIAESKAAEYARTYVANYDKIKQMYDKYVLARTEAEAEEIYAQMATLMDENNQLERNLEQTWMEIYDQKSYVYAYFFEKEERDDILDLTESMMMEAREEKLASIDNLASEPLADYRLQKHVILNYETYVAKLLNNTSAIDSLSNASRAVRQIDYRIPALDIERRSFVDYSAIEFTQRSPYNSQNPIPECIVYEYGTIYRILLGTFKYKQQVSIFRNASPLCIETLEDGRFSYYAGGFRSRTEAEKAVEVMKKKGFRNPQIVEWCDGIKTNLSEAGEVSYRLMISGGALTSEVREVIETMAVDCQLSRLAEDSFSVGMFASRAMADRVAQAITKSDSALTVEVEELRPEAEEEEE